MSLESGLFSAQRPFGLVRGGLSCAPAAIPIPKKSLPMDSLWIGVICKLVYLELVSNSQLGLDSRNRRISL
jgi:hypothetical protein